VNAERQARWRWTLTIASVAVALFGCAAIMFRFSHVFKTTGILNIEGGTLKWHQSSPRRTPFDPRTKQMLERLAARYPRTRFAWAPSIAQGLWYGRNWPLIEHEPLPSRPFEGIRNGVWVVDSLCLLSEDVAKEMAEYRRKDIRRFPPERFRPAYLEMAPTPFPPPFHIDASSRKPPPPPKLWHIEMPLWIPAALLAALALPMWWSVLHRRRAARAGTCPRCRYDLSGLPPGAPCPECGRLR
jgi:hypothetical protein